MHKIYGVFQKLWLSLENIKPRSKVSIKGHILTKGSCDNWIWMTIVPWKNDYKYFEYTINLLCLYSLGTEIIWLMSVLINSYIKFTGAKKRWKNAAKEYIEQYGNEIEGNK